MAKPLEIVILSGKGGTGKTSITAAFAAMAENAVLTDCDVDAADLHLILSPEIYHSEKFASGAKAGIKTENCTACGLCAELCRFNAIKVIRNEFTIDKYACEGCGLCKEACPADAIIIINPENNLIYLANCRFGPVVYGKLATAEENSGKLVSKIRQHAKSIARVNHAEIIITDGPPGIGCPAISSVTGASLVIAVTEPTLSGWHDLQRLIEMIDFFHMPVHVIINKYDLNKDISRAMENNLEKKGIPVLGKIPYDEAVVYALIQSKTITEYQPGGFIANELTRMWETILNIIYEPKSI
jgi:MinD superfamily P-loop ATPase